MNKYQRIGIYLLWLIAGLLNALILSRFYDLKISALLAHSLFRAAALCALSFPLGYVLRFANFKTLFLFQKIVNYSFLSIFTVAVWLGAGAAFDFIFLDNNTAKILAEVNFIYVPVGFFVFIIISQNVIIQSLKKDKNEEINFENEEKPSEKIQTESVEIIDRIAVKTNSKINLIPVSDVFYLASEGDYVLIYTESEKFLKEQTMKYFEQHLPDNFLRVHRSIIVNTEKISRIELLEKQTYSLFLKNGVKIRMSAAGYKKLRDLLNL